MRVPFRERNPVPIALISFAVIGLLIALALSLDRIPFLGGGTHTHTAAFSEAAGLRSGEEVRIAGVKVGKVTSLDLAGDHVKVTFEVDSGVPLGDRTGAEIKIKTLLGQHYLALVPRGTGRLSREIPLSRTHAPYEVTAAVQDLSSRISQIDYGEVAKSFDVLADTFRNSPDEIRASLRGLRRLSDTVASRDQQLHELAQRARSVSQLLADRNADFARLIDDGDLILREVRARREVIHQLLIRTVTLSQQVNGLISDNEEELRPMLANLQRVNRILLSNQDNLDRMIELYGPFARQFGDATGSGRWFDAYIQNLIPIPASIQPPSGDQSDPADRTDRTNPTNPTNPTPTNPTPTNPTGRTGQGGGLLPFLP